MVKSGTPETPGAEIHATVVHNFIHDSWYKPVPELFNVFILLLTAFITTFSLLGRRPIREILLTLLIIISVTTLAFTLWKTKWWMNLAAPLILIALTYITITASNFIQVELERRKTRAMFSRYVSPIVVDELMDNPDQIVLGGQRRVVIIMFCDIREFTAYSENNPPEEIVPHLNEYFYPL